MECLGNTWQKMSRRERRMAHLHSYLYKTPAWRDILPRSPEYGVAQTYTERADTHSTASSNIPKSVQRRLARQWLSAPICRQAHWGRESTGSGSSRSHRRTQGQDGDSSSIAWPRGKPFSHTGPHLAGQWSSLGLAMKHGHYRRRKGRGPGSLSWG